MTAAVRELLWGLRAVSREVKAWRRHAEVIPDVSLRDDALDAMSRKRGHTDGAAFFWTLPDRRNRTLLRTLVAYELLLDYLDGVSERGAVLGPETGRYLYLAAVDALDPSRTPSDYYRHHVSRDDGGYASALVTACRRGCCALPSYAVVRPLLVREAERALVLGLNHEPNPTRRAALLQAWATAELPEIQGLRWYEMTAAASGWLMTHVLLALAAQPGITRHVAETTYAAYFPWMGLAVTMLDSYVDQAADTVDGAHSYISYYPSVDVARARLCESIQRSAHDVLALPNGERHAVLLGCMIALYLSKDSVRAGENRRTTARIAAAGGTLPRLLLPVLRIWRLCNAQRAST